MASGQCKIFVNIAALSSTTLLHTFHITLHWHEGATFQAYREAKLC